MSLDDAVYKTLTLAKQGNCKKLEKSVQSTMVN